MALGYDCTCNRLWGSILPPPQCPVHGSSGGQFIHLTTKRCQGRHCRHDADCYWTGARTWNGTWTTVEVT